MVKKFFKGVIWFIRDLFISERGILDGRSLIENAKFVDMDVDSMTHNIGLSDDIIDIIKSLSSKANDFITDEVDYNKNDANEFKILCDMLDNYRNIFNKFWDIIRENGLEDRVVIKFDSGAVCYDIKVDNETIILYHNINKLVKIENCNVVCGQISKYLGIIYSDMNNDYIELIKYKELIK